MFSATTPTVSWFYVANAPARVGMSATHSTGEIHDKIRLRWVSVMVLSPATRSNPDIAAQSDQKRQARHTDRIECRGKLNDRSQRTHDSQRPIATERRGSSNGMDPLGLAGLFEVGWAIGLKYTEGFTRFWPTVGTVAAMVVSLGLLGVAMKSLPVGTSYAIWVASARWEPPFSASCCSVNRPTPVAWSALDSSSPVSSDSSSRRPN